MFVLASRSVAAAIVMALHITACGGNGGGRSGEPDACGAGAADDERAAAIVDVARDVMAKNGLNAVLLRITIDGEEIVTAALGESMTGVPATPVAHFRNGAVAISYLSTLLLQLVDRGTVGLDDPVSTWLPDLPAADRVTLRMLANSTSGYPDYVADDEFVDTFYANPFQQWTPEELIEIGMSRPLWYEPGTNWSYAHTNFVILGEALEAITGQPVETLMEENIIEPLGLHNTASSSTPEIPEPVLHTFTTERGDYEDSTFWNPSWQLARGALMTTNICDLSISAIAIGTGKLLSEESHQEQVGPSIVGLGGPTDTCPVGVCRQNRSTAYFGLGVVVLNSWIMQTPSFGGFGGVQAYLPSERVGMAIVATHGQASTPDTNFAVRLFERIAALLMPDHIPER